MIKVETLDKLKEYTLAGISDYVILLNDNLRSSKKINYDGKTWSIFNYIDGSKGKCNTNFIEAIDKGALYIDLDEKEFNEILDLYNKENELHDNK